MLARDTGSFPARAIGPNAGHAASSACDHSVGTAGGHWVRRAEVEVLCKAGGDAHEAGGDDRKDAPGADLTAGRYWLVPNVFK